jgi:hypothetical protein
LSDSGSTGLFQNDLPGRTEGESRRGLGGMMGVRSFSIITKLWVTPFDLSVCWFVLFSGILVLEWMWDTMFPMLHVVGCIGLIGKVPQLNPFVRSDCATVGSLDSAS